MSQKLQAYSVRDAKAEIFNVPFYGNTHGEAERSFTQVTNDPNSGINKFPEDYQLYHIGTYCQKTGKLDALKDPMPMVQAIQVLQQKPAQVSH